MSIFDRITKGRVKKPLFMSMYSGPGVGKTEFGASFPKPLFFDFEESTHNIDVERIDNITSFEDVMDGLHEILECEVGAFQFKSIIVDTIDELERLMHVYIAEAAGKQTIDHIGWQKGYDQAVNLWAKFIAVCRQIRDKHNIHFVFLAHSFTKYKTELEKETTWTRYSMNLHKKAADFIFGQVEMVLFAKKEVSFKKDSEGQIHAKDTDKRTLCTSLSAHYDAKNRIGLPPTLPMPYKNGFEVLWNAYEKAFNETAESVHKECTDLVKKIKDEKKVKEILSFIDTEKNKNDITVMRSSLASIKKIVEGQK